MTKMPSGIRRDALPRLPFSRLDNRGARGVSVAPLPRFIDRGTWTAAPLRGFCRHSTAAARPRHFMRGSFGGSLSRLCCLCTNRGASGSKPPRLSIFALFAQSSPVRAKIPLLSEKPTKTSKETLKPRFYPRNLLKRIRKGGYTKCRNRAISDSLARW